MAPPIAQFYFGVLQLNRFKWNCVRECTMAINKTKNKKILFENYCPHKMCLCRYGKRMSEKTQTYFIEGQSN